MRKAQRTKTKAQSLAEHTPEVIRRREPHEFDLVERTAVFGERVIHFCRTLPRDEITKPLISQLVRCGTSVGANYSEADDGESSKDYAHKVGIARKEAREAKHQLRMLATAVPDQRDAARELWREAHELNLIFSAIRRKLGGR